MSTFSKVGGKLLSISLLLLALVAGVVFWWKPPLPEFLRFYQPATATASATKDTEEVTPEPEAVKPAVDRTAQVVVLGYHRFVDKVRHPDTEITPAEFESQMQALKDEGITVIPLDDFLAWRNAQKSIPPRSAIITIDDGYSVGYTVAWPILKKYGYPFTMFIYTDYVSGGRRTGSGSLSWEQLAQMRDAGVSIQSHTVSHPDLRRKKGGGAKMTYDEWLWNELHGSKAMIEEKLGIKVSALALPYGLANDKVREAAAKAGYEMLFTVNGQKINYDTPMNALGRYIIEANNPTLFKMATTFDRQPFVQTSTPTVSNSPSVGAGGSRRTGDAPRTK